MNLIFNAMNIIIFILAVILYTIIIYRAGKNSHRYCYRVVKKDELIRYGTLESGLNRLGTNGYKLMFTKDDIFYFIAEK